MDSDVVEHYTHVSQAVGEAQRRDKVFGEILIEIFAVEVALMN